MLCFCAGSRIFLRFQKAIDTIVYRDHARDGKGAWIGGPRRWVLQQGGSLVLVLYTTVGTLSSMCIGFGMRLLMCAQDLRLQFSVAQNGFCSIEHAYVGFVQKWSFAEALRVSKREMSVATRGTEIFPSTRQCCSNSTVRSTLSAKVCDKTSKSNDEVYEPFYPRDGSQSSYV